jgi:polysaccharide biosynthesis/export protein
MSEHAVSLVRRSASAEERDRDLEERMRASQLGRASVGAATLVLGLWAAAGRVPAQEVGPPIATTEGQPETGLYVFESGDEVTIKVFGMPQLEETVRIRPDGRISVLLVDDIVAAGLTTRELDERLTSRYAEYLRDPQVTLVVRSYANLKVYVGGEVAAPGPLPLVGKLTALGAVLQAGGFKGTARTNSVILIRNSGGDRPRVERLNLAAVYNKGEPDVPLKPFDVVYVPMSTIAKVDKFVDQYVRQLLPIALTGGFTYILGDHAILIPR